MGLKILSTFAPAIQNTGCSSVGLECRSGGPVVAGSSPVIPTQLQAKATPKELLFLFHTLQNGTRFHLRFMTDSQVVLWENTRCIPQKRPSTLAASKKTQPNENQAHKKSIHLRAQKVTFCIVKRHLSLRKRYAFRKSLRMMRNGKTSLRKVFVLKTPFQTATVSTLYTPSRHKEH